MSDNTSSSASHTTARIGVIMAVALTVLTAVTFILALTALPNKVPYPFNQDVIVEQWPGDYLWMPPAMLLMVVFVGVLAALHEQAGPDRRIYSLIALGMGIPAATVLVINYYLQFTVMPISLEKDQLDGWALFTQYNPQGIFIALEELGYMLMSLVLLAVAPVVTGPGRVAKTLRVLLALQFVVMVLSLMLISALLGRERGDIFEITVITLVWVVLLIAGPLLAIWFRRSGARVT
ncbi:hypothetical protein HMPREF0290_0113 [Corynebacterium efficiens YS-314]|nr:hypothetical protein [Corynebacterium efficiens]EEW51274.1 hypothetical protein HMPREF0290_0113 [Corynebacterium efficiens YS-314]